MAVWCLVAQAFDPVADMALRYTTQVDRRLALPEAEVRFYAQLAEQALANAGVTPAGAEYLILVDRDLRS